MVVQISACQVAENGFWPDDSGVQGDRTFCENADRFTTLNSELRDFPQSNL
jgi:hypothetical protein